MTRMSQTDRESLLREALSTTLSVIRAIHGAGLFDTLPEDEHEVASHNDGIGLLNLLQDRLHDIEGKIKADDDLVIAASKASA